MTRQQVDQGLDEFLANEVIETCRTKWAFNVVIVRKKDGSTRFCVDYRRLNDLTEKYSYSLSRIDTCLDTLSGAVWYSTFDRRSGFHQVAMDPRDANKTAFVCHRGTFRFKKMPFGLCNAPAAFQLLMVIVMAGLNFEICLVYLDDILVFSQNLRQHLERLRTLFERLRQANFKLKPSKWHLMQRRVTFLGFVLSEERWSENRSKQD